MKAKDIGIMAKSQASSLIEFEGAELIGGINPTAGPILVVWGTKPCINMEVHLIERVYVDTPQYWGIEVVGIVPGGICLPVVAPYHETLFPVPLGKKGVKVIGATKSEKLAWP